MNIIELMAEVGITSPDGFKLTVNPVQVEKMQAFANAVIAAHTAELIEGVGEPSLSRRKDREYLDTYEYRKGNSDPMFWEQFYTAEQVAGAVAQAKVVVDQHYCMTIVAQNKRIAMLESTLKVALEALERVGNWGGTTRYTGSGSYTDVARFAFEKCKEVLHG